jgi:rSAM/selenodomain-associated transferase 1
MRTEVLVFAREPAPGRVKSRLAATLGPERAAAAYAALLDHTLGEATHSGLTLVLALADPPSALWERELELPLMRQRGADLGARMAAAFARCFAAGAERVVLVGSDCPGLAAAHLRQAAAALSEVPVVLGPAADGGYWLVAQRRPGLELFAGVPWSSAETLGATRTRLRGLGADWRELEALGDIDTEDDLRAAIDDESVSAQLRRRLREIVERSNVGTFKR